MTSDLFRRPRPSTPIHYRPMLEEIEKRLALSVFTVTNTNDAGGGSLRDAIQKANVTPITKLDPFHAIEFKFGGIAVQTIMPLTQLDPITNTKVTINGFTYFDFFKGLPLIQLDGSKAGGGANGLTLAGTLNSVLGLAINRFGGNGIRLTGGGSHSLAKNLLGTNTDGNAPLANANNGVFIDNVPLNVIRDNVISGNSMHGVEIKGPNASENKLFLNRIGTDFVGKAAVANLKNGVFSNGAPANLIGFDGGNCIGNLLSGNQENGVLIKGDGASGNTVQCNLIGVDMAGGKLPNMLDGVRIDGLGAPAGSVAGNVIGGVAAMRGNVISGNMGNGVDVAGPGATKNTVQSNYIGTDAASSKGVQNNLDGVLINNAPANTIGGLVGPAGPGIPIGNIIASNKGNGVKLIGIGAPSNLVQGNLIGVDAALKALSNGGDGILISGAPSNTIGGVVNEGNVISANKLEGVEVTGPDAAFNKVRNNFIGGGATLANGSNGVLLLAGAHDNVIGGVLPGGGGPAGNIISGNTLAGVVLTGTGTDGNKIQSNNVGVDTKGTKMLPNLVGVAVFAGAKSNHVGGGAAGEGNVISANTAHGVWISGGGTTNNDVRGNTIGLDAPGKATLANGKNGVLIDFGANDNFIGGVGAGNVISGNKLSGVLIIDPGTDGNRVLGNNIGVDAMGMVAFGNNQSGVTIAGGAQGNKIGGNIAGEGNLIRNNNQDGVTISGPGTNKNRVEVNTIRFNGGDGVNLSTKAQKNVVSGNKIEANANGVQITDDGTNLNEVLANFIGSIAMPNAQDGVRVANGAKVNLVSLNDIGNNTGSGITITDPGTDGNFVTANFVIGNKGLQGGVAILGGAGGNFVGGFIPEARNVIGGNVGPGVRIDGSGNQLAGNYIGLDLSGKKASPNGLPDNPQPGVLITGTENKIGPNDVISGNTGAGVQLTGNLAKVISVFNELIGTDFTGTKITDPDGKSLGNAGAGVFLNDAPSNTIGGTDEGAGNVIAGNGADGVLIQGANAIGNLLQGNRIGTNAAGAALGNGGNGIFISGASDNKIGGSAPGEGNIIAFNGGKGVLVDTGTGNLLSRNAIFSHSERGIQLINGGNNGQSFPVVTSAVSDDVGTTIQGTLSSAPNTDFTLEFFSNTVCNPSGFGEGEVFKTALPVTTDADGNVSFEVMVAPPVAVGQFITATATDPSNNTSEFSACVAVTAPAAPAIGGLVIANASMTRNLPMPGSPPSQTMQSTPERTRQDNPRPLAWEQESGVVRARVLFSWELRPALDQASTSMRSMSSVAALDLWFARLGEH